jgi:hypothetical protein
MGNFWISPNVQQPRPTVHPKTQKEIEIAKYADHIAVALAAEGIIFCL